MVFAILRGSSMAPVCCDRISWLLKKLQLLRPEHVLQAAMRIIFGDGRKPVLRDVRQVDLIQIAAGGNRLPRCGKSGKSRDCFPLMTDDGVPVIMKRHQEIRAGLTGR